MKKKWEDREVISVNLSFNQIKSIMSTYRQYQPSSPQGKLCQKLLLSLRNHLKKQAESGNLPDEITKQLLS